MPTACVRFYEELNDFLPKDKRKMQLLVSIAEGATAKAIVEKLGVPHPEIDLVLVNGESVAFDYKLADGDRMSVYPVFEAFDISHVSKVRPEPLRTPRFVLDVHLGKLSVLLRMLGLDALYCNTFTDQRLSQICEQENRILLTRDRSLLMRNTVRHGYCVRSPHPYEQVVEVVRRLDLPAKCSPFTRCLRCNKKLAESAEENLRDRLPEFVRQHYSHFRECPLCGHIYWRGSHWQRMNAFVEKLGLPRG